jgi:hypothetical protein
MLLHLHGLILPGSHSFSPPPAVCCCLPPCRPVLIHTPVGPFTFSDPFTARCARPLSSRQVLPCPHGLPLLLCVLLMIFFLPSLCLHQQSVHAGPGLPLLPSFPASFCRFSAIFHRSRYVYPFPYFPFSLSPGTPYPSPSISSEPWTGYPSLTAAFATSWFLPFPPFPSASSGYKRPLYNPFPALPCLPGLPFPSLPLCLNGV